MTTSLLRPGFAETEKFGVGPDFSVYTGAMTPDLSASPIEVSPIDLDKPLLAMRGSSTIQDLQGDDMSLHALQSMTNVAPDLTLWLNHSYDLPNDAFGKLFQKPKIVMESGIADLWLAEETFLRNPNAEKTYDLITKDGARFGCSVGCQVLKFEFVDPDDPWFSPLHIDEVYVVEWSVVGIPASQRCWVENAIKGIFARSLVEGDGEKALSLAPAFKGLFAKQYNDVVRNVTSTGLRKELERTSARYTAQQRIIYDFTEGREGFTLRNARGAVVKSLTREEVSTLLEKDTQGQLPSSLLKGAFPGSSDEELQHVENALEQKLLDTSLSKAASGKTSWDLADIGTEWTGSKAEQQIFSWAKNDDGEIVASKAKQCFLWYDPDNSDKQSGYKMPFTYIVSGTPKIVPKGVQACANVLSGGRGGGSFGGDDAGMKAKVKTMYGRINSQFNPDPAWIVPWEKEEKSMEDEIETKAKEKDGIADSESDAPINRQDLNEEMPAAKDVKVNDDGTHEAAKGDHEHDHADGSGDSHSHSHAHNGDANHADHQHDDSDTEDDDAQKSQQEIMTKAVEVSQDGTHAAFTGSHSHQHKAFGSQGDDDLHEHTHSHDGDSDHKHAHEGKKSESPAEEKSVEAVDPHRLSLLSIYNNIGKELGFSEVPLDATKCLDGANQQQLVTLVSQLDTCLDGISAYQIATASDVVDQLMSLLGIPDADKMPASDVASPYPLYDSFTPVFEKALENFFTIKAGREINSENRGKLKAVHDIIAGMHPGVCDSAVTVDEATDEARAQGEGQPIQQYPSMQNSIDAINNLAKSFGSLNVDALVKKALEEELGNTHAVLTETHKSFELLQREQAALAENQRVLVENNRKLKEMPLGRPTTFVGRTVVEEDGVATHEEMLHAGVKSLPYPDSELEVVEVQTGRGMMKHKRWPKGYRVGERPPLTESQKTFMNPLMYGPYIAGTCDVLVPCVD
ncbi:MAG TPA: hypothetical protein VH593_16835 [Ktedonobacteraceae bacterium]|jgi:hypothetical protein